jgi:outer membrane protein assembly factor BamB
MSLPMQYVRYFRTAFHLLAFTTICFLPITAYADDWPMTHHDAQNTGYTTAQLAPPLRLAWCLKTTRFACPLLATQNVVCARTVREHLRDVPRFWKGKIMGWALTRVYVPTDTLLIDKHGKTIWSVHNAAPIYFHDDCLIVYNAELTGNGARIVRYDWRAQKELWAHPLGFNSGYFVGGVADNNVLYLVTRQEQNNKDISVLTALNLDDGTQIAQKLQTDEYEFGAPSATGENVFVGAGHWLHVLDVAKLQVEWGFWDAGFKTRIFDDVLIGRNYFRWVVAVDLKTHKLLWRTETHREFPPFLVSGENQMLDIEFSDGNDRPVQLEAYAMRTGELVWRYPMLAITGAGSGHCAYVAGGHKHLPGRTTPVGGFYCFDAHNGKLVWKYEKQNLMGGQIIIGDNTLYGLDSDGYLYKFVSSRKGK